MTSRRPYTSRRMTSRDEKTAALMLRLFLGATHREIGAALGRHKDTIRYWLDSDRRKAVKDAVRRCTDNRTPEQHDRYKFRAYARREAKESGRPVVEIFEQWGCL